MAQKKLLDELRSMERGLTLPSLVEAIRLLKSDRFSELTEKQIRAVAEYQAIELGSDCYFEKAFTPGKEAAASLGFARLLGREVVLDDLQRLFASAQDSPPSRPPDADEHQDE
jgi:hypothetical protein